MIEFVDRVHFLVLTTKQILTITKALDHFSRTDDPCLEDIENLADVSDAFAAAMRRTEEVARAVREGG